MNRDEVLKDLAAFADDDSAVEMDPAGYVLLERRGEEVSFKLEESDSGGLFAAMNGDRIAYRDLLARSLGRLDLLASRILERRDTAPGAFVESQATLDQALGHQESGSALELLKAECDEPLPFAVRLAFITADAGHGKSALLKELQRRSAEAYLERTSPYLFWHVDLQGRQLLRLSEALAGDLGELRFDGLWTAAIYRLIRAGALVLAIDGFDELAAEQGSSDALGALAGLLRELEGKGVVVAASRTAFFDAGDYMRRARRMQSILPPDVSFDQLRLEDWGEREGREYFNRARFDGESIENPDDAYERLESALSRTEHGHPILTRPYLVYQAAKALSLGVTPETFVHGMEGESGVAAVVSAFVQREVQEKWRPRGVAGDAYLSFEQHMAILGDVAEEMFLAGRDRIGVDVVETVTALRLDEWAIDLTEQQQVMEMVRMHALLRQPEPDRPRERSFDHPEFRDYFLAQSMRRHLVQVGAGGSSDRLGSFLAVAPISDSTAGYACSLAALPAEQALHAARELAEAVRAQWKPTHLQVNAGTLIPPLLSGHAFEPGTELDAERVAFASLVLDGSALRGLTLKNAQFVNARIRNVDWQNVTLDTVDLGELELHIDTTTFEDCSLDGCSISGLIVMRENSEIERIFAPESAMARLAAAGLPPGGDEQLELPALHEPSEMNKQAHRLLRRFYRSTVISSLGLPERFKSSEFDPERALELMTELGLAQKESWRGQGTATAWKITCNLDELLEAESGRGPDEMVKFWREVERCR